MSVNNAATHRLHRGLGCRRRHRYGGSVMMTGTMLAVVSVMASGVFGRYHHRVSFHLDCRRGPVDIRRHRSTRLVVFRSETRNRPTCRCLSNRLYRKWLGAGDRRRRHRCRDGRRLWNTGSRCRGDAGSSRLGARLGYFGSVRAGDPPYLRRSRGDVIVTRNHRMRYRRRNNDSLRRSRLRHLRCWHSGGSFDRRSGRPCHLRCWHSCCTRDGGLGRFR